jgi:hypothetical protein
MADDSVQLSGTTIPDQTTQIGRRVSFTIDLDPALRDSLSYAASGLPRRAHFDPITRTFSWIPFEGQEGTWVITFVATEGSGLAVAVPVRIRVATRSSSGRQLDAEKLRRIIDLDGGRRSGARAKS